MPAIKFKPGDRVTLVASRLGDVQLKKWGGKVGTVIRVSGYPTPRALDADVYIDWDDTELNDPKSSWGILFVQRWKG